MIRVTAYKSASQATKYFVGELAPMEYYSEGQKIKGRWGGKAAAWFALEGEVFPEHFEALAQNQDPDTGERLTLRNKNNRRVGFDFNFNPPKSVSIAHAFTKDDRIIEAMNRAVEETMKEIEAAACTRVRRDGFDADRPTGNLVWAHFTLTVARPVDGVPDPHLHAHCFVFNVTYDDVEKTFKAAQLRDAIDHTDDYNAAFLTRLAANLEALGYRTERSGKSFELDGVPRSVIEKFSRRTKRIETVREERGIKDPKRAAELGAATREPKQPELFGAELDALWESRLTPDELSMVKGLGSSRPTPSLIREQSEARIATDKPPVRSATLFGTRRTAAAHTSQTPSPVHKPTPITKHEVSKQPQPVLSHRTVFENDPKTIRNALDYAMDKCFERLSVVDERHLAATALWHTLGKVDPAVMRAVIDERVHQGALLRRRVEGRVVLTTPQIVEEEHRAVAWARNGKNALPPLVAGAMPHLVTPDPEVEEALRTVLGSRDRLAVLVGKSGAGKSTFMKLAIPAIEATGKKVTILAPTSDASRGTLGESGFHEADTLARLLHSTKAQDAARGGAWWIDEAGLMSIQDMVHVFQLAETLDARIILSGDPRQHRSVQRGDAFRLLLEHGELSPATLETIKRQSGTYREAVDSMAENRLAEAFEKLDAMGAFVEIPSYERHFHLAREYLAAIEAGETALIVSPTHAESRRVTSLVREGLKASGQLSHGKQFPVLRRIDLQAADLRMARNHTSETVIEIVKPLKDDEYPMGQRLLITSVDKENGRVFVGTPTGTVKEFDLAKHAEGIQVFERAWLPIAVGEQIRITRNGRSMDGRGLNNGTLGTVVGFTDEGHLRLHDDKVLSKHFSHIDHGYCTTSYAAQSKTVDRVFVAEGWESFPAASREQFYVSISRGRASVRIFTDDKEALFEAVQRSSQRLAALDVEKARQLELSGMQAVMGILTSETMAPIVHVIVPVSCRLGREMEEERE